jgi:FkbM family methyltransferase
MSPRTRRIRLLENVDLVVDVGANRGQFAEWLRRLGFSGRIVSFEPLASAYSALEERVRGDPRWTCHRFALGDRRARARIHVAGQEIASSFLQPTKATVEAAPGMAQTRSEMVDVVRLDEVWSDVVGEPRRCYLKIDVEGYEMPVLRGGESSLRRTAFVETELSVRPVYTHGPVLLEVAHYLASAGFSIVSLEPNQTLEDGQILMMDCVFRSELRRAT